MKRKAFFNTYKLIYTDCTYKIRSEGMVVAMCLHIDV